MLSSVHGQEVFALGPLPRRFQTRALVDFELPHRELPSPLRVNNLTPVDCSGRRPFTSTSLDNVCL